MDLTGSESADDSAQAGDGLSRKERRRLEKEAARKAKEEARQAREAERAAALAEEEAKKSEKKDFAHQYAEK